ncbi:glycogen debranching N-terminal domain-containing protein [Frankia sp. QA3]|uniref:amylo-alpha-1,6-glucosidase n=1 Tax=Frankia sp. QA3 TaxID=710111 RepID=UPI000269CE58|nr:glycogen debranching N-terminal domain-containing protein [Frankia sp. QA3]EIV96195.1 glycogen debranching enzyme [Frankia sp. QA3]
MTHPAGGNPGNQGNPGHAGAWASGSAPPVLPSEGGTVTVLEGSVFCLSSTVGDVHAGRPHGLFVADTRVLSQWHLQLDGVDVEPLATLTSEPYTATFVGRSPPRPGSADSALLVVRTRVISDGMREDIAVRNLGREAAAVVVTLTVDVDFADLFQVKENRVPPMPAVDADTGTDTMTFTHSTPADTRTAQLTVTGEAELDPRTITFREIIPGRSEWSTRLSVQAAMPGRAALPRYRSGEELVPARRRQAWRLANPVVRTGSTQFIRTLRRSSQDLGALQVHDPMNPDRRVVAAGAPWFMTLFGRDSLLAGWMALPLDQQLAAGTLQTLARYQGDKIDPLTEEEPGRILHEIRLGQEATLALGHGQVYYGTADATPLFVALLGELHRWGLSRAEIHSLLPAADRALRWIDEYGDRDGDGFVEYHRATDRGLFNQGWKDSFDGVNDSAGRLAEPPIALAEVQAYVYAAFLARADIAAADGDDGLAARHRTRAAALKEAFNDRFWLPEKGWYAIGLDRYKRPIDSLTSNMGHCLWCGIVDRDKAAAVARHLVDAPLWTGFGVRTLAASMGAYNPVSYHNGSVWPHDTAIAATGLMRYGFVAEAQRIALGLFDAADRFLGRLPELFCGFDRADFPRPIPYPTSCSPQAWAAAAPVQLARTLLRFEPDLPAGRLTVAPVVPERLLPLRVEHLPLADARLTIAVDADGVTVDGLPAGITPVTTPPPH